MRLHLHTGPPRIGNEGEGDSRRRPMLGTSVLDYLPQTSIRPRLLWIPALNASAGNRPRGSKVALLSESSGKQSTTTTGHCGVQAALEMFSFKKSFAHKSSLCIDPSFISRLLRRYWHPFGGQQFALAKNSIPIVIATRIVFTIFRVPLASRTIPHTPQPHLQRSLKHKTRRQTDRADPEAPKAGAPVE